MVVKTKTFWGGKKFHKVDLKKDRCEYTVLIDGEVYKRHRMNCMQFRHLIQFKERSVNYGTEK